MSITIFITASNPIITSRESIIDSKTYDHIDKVLLLNFPYEVFEELVIDGKRHLRPIKYPSPNIRESLAFREDQKKLNILGKGSYGEVYNYSDSPVAVKRIKHTILEDNNILLEIVNNYHLRNVSGVNKMLDCKYYTYNTVLYLEKMQCTLSKLIGQEGYIIKPRQIMFNILKTVYNIHKKGIVHLDLKLDNILVNEFSDVFISDFGLSNFVPYIGELSNAYKITSTYRAPEVFLSKNYDASVDIFSLGIILYELYTRITNYLYRKKAIVNIGILNTNNINIFKNLIHTYDITNKKQYKKFDQEIFLLSENLEEIENVEGILLFMQMTCNIREIRPTIAEALNHPFFDGIRHEKFSEIDTHIILDHLSELNAGPKRDASFRLDAFRDMFSDFLNLNTLLLAMRLFNNYSDNTNYYAPRVCVYIAGILTDCADRWYHNSEEEHVIMKIFNELKDKMYCSLPFLYVQNIDRTSLTKLIKFEVFYEHFKKYSSRVLADSIKDPDSHPIITRRLERLKCDAIDSIVDVCMNMRREKFVWQKRDHSMDKKFLERSLDILKNKFGVDSELVINSGDISKGVKDIAKAIRKPKSKSRSSKKLKRNINTK